MDGFFFRNIPFERNNRNEKLFLIIVILSSLQRYFQMVEKITPSKNSQVRHFILKSEQLIFLNTLKNISIQFLILEIECAFFYCSEPFFPDFNKKSYNPLYSQKTIKICLH